MMTMVIVIIVLKYKLLYQVQIPSNVFCYDRSFSCCFFKVLLDEGTTETMNLSFFSLQELFVCLYVCIFF